MERRFDLGKKCTPLEERPSLYGDLASIWKAFWQLNATRSHGMGGSQPLQLTEMKAYLELFPDFDAKDFIEIMILMDSIFLNYMGEQQEKEDELEDKRVRK